MAMDGTNVVEMQPKGIAPRAEDAIEQPSELQPLYAKYCDEVPTNPAVDAYYEQESQRGILGEVWCILKEAYSPFVIAKKLFPTIRIRCLKVIGMIVNQKAGALLCGWNGKENRIYDRVGFLTDLLFLKLYHRPLQQRDVMLFLHRRLHYAFITAIFTTVQILLTWKGYVFLALILSCILVPVTMIDRQWATSVTKNPPRYVREVILNQLQWPIDSMISQSASVARSSGEATASSSVGPVDPRFAQYYPPRRVRWPAILYILTIVEICNGFIQFNCAAALFVLPGLMIVSAKVRGFNVSDSISMYTVLNGFRIAKELSNWISPAIEWIITPMKYRVSDGCLLSLMTSLRTVPLELLAAVVAGGTPKKELKFVENHIVAEHRERLHGYIDRLQQGISAAAAAVGETVLEDPKPKVTPDPGTSGDLRTIRFSTLPHFFQKASSLTKDFIVVLCTVFESAMNGIHSGTHGADNTVVKAPPLTQPLLGKSAERQRSFSDE